MLSLSRIDYTVNQTLRHNHLRLYVKKTLSQCFIAAANCYYFHLTLRGKDIHRGVMWQLCMMVKTSKYLNKYLLQNSKYY